MIRFAKWIALAGALASASVAARAHANGFSPEIGGISLEFWAGIIFTVLLALIAGYARGIEKRVSLIEFDNRHLQSQISGIREMVKGEYHPKDEVHEQIAEVKKAIDSLHRRFDYFGAAKAGMPFPEH